MAINKLVMLFGVDVVMLECRRGGVQVVVGGGGCARGKCRQACVNEATMTSRELNVTGIKNDK